MRTKPVKKSEAKPVVKSRTTRTSPKKSTETAAVAVLQPDAPVSGQMRSETQQFYPQDEIARVAYSYWVSRGGANGNDMEDWLRAEREVLRKYAQSQSKN